MSIRYDMASINPEQLTAQVRQDTGYVEVAPRSEMELFSEYLDWVRQGKKTTTVRYRRGAIDCPTRVHLPLYATTSYTGVDREWAGWVILRGMTLKKFGDLSLEDAVEDGFLAWKT